jgi:penicillin amidase
LKLSVPVLDGVIKNPHIDAKVTVKRDWRGIPLIEADTLADSIYTIGFLHGQERFFQMDLVRRHAAGELAELFGSSAIDKDKTARLHRFRNKAVAALAQLPSEQREILDNYTKGVNEGLQVLDGMPYEYRLMLTSPDPWLAEDSILVNMAMYLLLQANSGEHPEIISDKLSKVYSRDYVDFLMATHSEWDVAVDGSAFKPVGFLSAKQNLLMNKEIPEGADNFSFTASLENNPLNEISPGSNSWVVSSAFKSLGRAMLANDMHLPLQIPNSWYALSMTYKHQGEARQTTGLTIPGLPVIAAGSNGAIAWGLTNVNGDWSDLVRLKMLDDDHYQTTQGIKKIERFQEQIKVRGGETVTVEVQETQWGPIIKSKDEHIAYALNWVAHYPSANNLNAVGLITAKTLDGAIDIATGSGMAHVNIVMADTAGDTAWTVMGRLPNRSGFDGARSQSWDQGDKLWQGWLTSAEYPTLYSADHDTIWTANNRVVGGEAAKTIGKGARYALGARAMRIRDALQAMDKVDEHVMHSLQLDTVNILMPRWQSLMLTALEGVEDKMIRQQIYPLVGQWDGTANKDSAGYRMLRAFRTKVADRVMQVLAADALSQYPSLRWHDLSLQWESPVWAAVEARSEEALPEEFGSWDELLEYLITDEIYPFYNKATNGDITQAKWGNVNRFHPQHPLTKVLPLDWLLNLPSEGMSGDKNVPIAQFGNFGASMRMVVSPSQEDKGLLTMPVGQAGNPLTPYFGAGHQQWLEGKPLPFLPQDAQYELVLKPGA